MTGGYAKAGVKDVQGYAGWTNVSSSPYQSATHGNRYVNNYANKYAAYRYRLFEKAGGMPVGSVIAKDSFLVKANGKLAAGPLFIMKKMPAGFSKDTGNWQYSMIMPNGKLVGTTNGKGSATVKFCAECHAGRVGDPGLLVLPAGGVSGEVARSLALRLRAGPGQSSRRRRQECRRRFFCA